MKGTLTEKESKVLKWGINLANGKTGLDIIKGNTSM